MQKIRKVVYVMFVFVFLFILSGCSSQPKTTQNMLDTKGLVTTRDFKDVKGFGVIDYTKFPNPSQAILAAHEAALVDAYAKATEFVYGLIVEGGSSVENFALKDKTVETRLRGVIRGAEEISTEGSKDADGDGIYSVVLRIYRKAIEETLGMKLQAWTY